MARNTRRKWQSARRSRDKVVRPPRQVRGPRIGEHVVACAEIDPQDLRPGLYWWKDSIAVQRLWPPANFHATWLCLCQLCNVKYSNRPAVRGEVRSDGLITQDFVLTMDIYLEATGPDEHIDHDIAGDGLHSMSDIGNDGIKMRDSSLEEERQLGLCHYLVGILASDPLALTSLRLAIKRMSDSKLAELIENILNLGPPPDELAHMPPEELASLVETMTGMLANETQIRNAEKN